MKEQALIFISIILIGLAPCSFAFKLDKDTTQSKNDLPFIINLTINQSFGETSYTLNALADINGNVSEVRSQLDFPLDAINIGLSFGWNKFNRWGLLAEISTSLSNPNNDMQDRDWINDVLVGNTLSDVELNMLYTSVEGSYQLISREQIKFQIITRLYNQKIWQHIDGYKGWHVDVNTGQKELVSGDEPAIYYKLNYLSFGGGGNFIWKPCNIISFQIDAVFGLTYAKDFDDHLIRGKESKGYGLGYNVGSKSLLSFYPGKNKGQRFPISLTGHVQYYHINGTQNMYWYKDEVNTPAGTAINNIPHEFKSLQYSFGLQFGFIF